MTPHHLRSNRFSRKRFLELVKVCPFLVTSGLVSFFVVIAHRQVDLFVLKKHFPL